MTNKTQLYLAAVVNSIKMSQVFESELERRHKRIKELEKELLAENGNHKDWECTEELMKLTKDGKALYMHCLPADITGVSCEEGEVEASVFDRYRVPLYKEAGFKPYIIAAMMFLSKVKDPKKVLEQLEAEGKARWNG